MTTPAPEDELLRTHAYDGIQEYDNPMPGWWTFIFVANIVWAAVYFVGINIEMIPNARDDLRAEMAIQAELENRNRKALPPVTPEMLAAALADEATVTAGAEVFAMNCATCHGQRGEGLIGPNLADDAWLNGDGELPALHQVIARGTPNGMPPWGQVLPQDQLVGVAAFVRTLRGTSPPNPKAPEGRRAAAEIGDSEEDG